MRRFTTGKLNQKGFTLVELLIVVIILAVLAAIVVPQFGSSTQDAREAALRTSLTEMRNAIELYYHQHNSTYPGANSNAGAPVAAGDAAAFLQQLTQYTELNGTVAATRSATARFGPYLKASSLPANPIDDLTTLTLNNTGSLSDPLPAAAAVGGWWFDINSGKFIANSNIGGTDYRTW